MFLLLLQHVLNKQPARQNLGSITKVRVSIDDWLRTTQSYFTHLHNETLLKQLIYQKFLPFNWAGHPFWCCTLQQLPC